MFLIQRTFKNDFRDTQLGRMEAWNTLEEVEPKEYIKFPQSFPIVTTFNFATEETANGVAEAFKNYGLEATVNKVGKQYKFYPEELSYNYKDRGFELTLFVYYMHAVELIPKLPIGKLHSYFYWKSGETKGWLPKKDFTTRLNNVVTQIISTVTLLDTSPSEKVTCSTRADWIKKVKEELPIGLWDWYLTEEEKTEEP